MRKIKLTSSLYLLLCFASPALSLTLEEAHHLLNRSGFNTNLTQAEQLSSFNRSSAIKTIISEAVANTSTVAPPKGIKDILDRKKFKSATEQERKNLRRQQRQRAIELKSWWYQQMVNTSTPLKERMTLFWHNHFTSSLRKVKSPALMYQQNVLLRQHALGNFKTLLKKILKNPAMLIYLDNISNRKQQPNENLARELLELFTLGEGNYSEQDIKQAALALTGWSVNRKNGEFMFRKRWHDNGSKTFLKQQGNYDGDDLVDIILQQDAVAKLITKKLWKVFVSQSPDPIEVNRIAKRFKLSGYDISAALEALFNSNQFWDKKNRATLIKSPVELLVGMVRTFNLELKDNRVLTRTGRSLGQDIFNPPNVKGWQGGNAWITSDSLTIRHQIIARLIKALDDKKTSMKNSSFYSMNSQSIVSLLLPTAPVTPINLSSSARSVIQQCLKDPVFQLK